MFGLEGLHFIVGNNFIPKIRTLRNVSCIFYSEFKRCLKTVQCDSNVCRNMMSSMSTELQFLLEQEKKSFKYLKWIVWIKQDQLLLAGQAGKGLPTEVLIMLYPKQASLGVFLNCLCRVQKNCKQCHETEKTEREWYRDRAIAGQDWREGQLFPSLLLCCTVKTEFLERLWSS